MLLKSLFRRGWVPKRFDKSVSSVLFVAISFLFLANEQIFLDRGGYDTNSCSDREDIGESTSSTGPMKESSLSSSSSDIGTLGTDALEGGSLGMVEADI